MKNDSAVEAVVMLALGTAKLGLSFIENESVVTICCRAPRYVLLLVDQDVELEMIILFPFFFG